MAQLTAAEKAAQAAAREQPAPEQESLTDVAPPGALEVCGRPIRHLSAADLRIVNNMMTAQDVDEMELMQVLLFCLLEEKIDKLWKLARDPKKLRAAVLQWSAELPATEFVELMAAAGPVWTEFNQVSRMLAGNLGGGDGDGKKKTG